MITEHDIQLSETISQASEPCQNYQDTTKDLSKWKKDENGRVCQWHYTSKDLSSAFLYVDSWTTTNKYNNCKTAKLKTGAPISDNLPCFRCRVCGPPNGFIPRGFVNENFKKGIVGGASQFQVKQGAVRVIYCEKMNWEK